MTDTSEAPKKGINKREKGKQKAGWLQTMGVAIPVAIATALGTGGESKAATPINIDGQNNDIPELVIGMENMGVNDTIVSAPGTYQISVNQINDASPSTFLFKISLEDIEKICETDDSGSVTVMSPAGASVGGSNVNMDGSVTAIQYL